MAELQKALIATHEERNFSNGLKRLFRGYEVHVTSAVEETLQRCKEIVFDLYVIELNLGHRATDDIIPAITIYNVLREQGMEGLEQRFVGFTGWPKALEAAADQPFKSVDKFKLVGYISELVKTAGYK